ncbi:hypothetical protein AVEN_157958-1 [Araneus ventricosus]|uniref:Retrotransposon gag domain-containing protein n=1 Tax=Araneus ventricosus TaxID=182803 RepID=A0A4Y2ICU8_ARAVE|nr:hypothetical protein AVEN_157958-1 [Araneus ventricosus]
MADETKPIVMSLNHHQLRSPSTFRGETGEDPAKWLTEHDRVAKFNKWDEMMCLANVYFFLDGTAKQWYINNEDIVGSWDVFKTELSGIFRRTSKIYQKGRRTIEAQSTILWREYAGLYPECLGTLPGS